MIIAGRPDCRQKGAPPAMSDPSQHKFQIDLRGIIGVLSQSLYSGPKVFVRELLQNACDAIRARTLIDPSAPRTITIEPARHDDVLLLTFTDTGVGLTEDEVHNFLATIGSSSKRTDLGAARADFIGNFGIGLLSCFMVSDEIVMVTRSARSPDAPALEWRGRSDGTYAVRALADRTLSPGTRVYLRASAAGRALFDYAAVKEIAAHYGSLLPYPVEVTAPGGGRVTVNADVPPWRREFASPAQRRAAGIAYGQEVFGGRFLDAIEVNDPDAGVEGIALVLPETPSLSRRGGHRVYLKGMLLTDKVDGILPEWAFFARLIVNSTGLSPSASRESVHEDEALAATHDAIDAALRRYVVGLASEDPDRLKKLIAVHYLAIKALAARDPEVYRVFIDWLPFETSLGTMTLAEVARRDGTVRFVPSHDRFRQISQIMAAQDVCVVDGGYTYDSQLIEQYGSVRGDVNVQPVEPSELAHELEPLDVDDRNASFDLLTRAQQALRRYRVQVDIRRFSPAEIPTLYSIDGDAEFRRNLERTKESASALWGDMLEGIARQNASPGQSNLVLNWANPLVQRLAKVSDERLVTRAIEMLYVQSLLLGHHPLNRQELSLLNTGLLDLIEAAVRPHSV
jgi:molecular chaperone HtpG